MAEFQKIKFLIDHIDPLGQGVHKANEDIFFIPKTLPGESGTARVLKSKKNIHFCEVLALEQKSPKRSPSACEHFSKCPGCHFLHTDYESEIEFKKNSFSRMLAQVGGPSFETVTAPERLAYRNRIQLHYDKRRGKIGFVHGRSNSILEVPRCQIIRPELKSELDRLYAGWKNSAKKSRGHVEIYLGKNGNVKVTWDRRYAEGGFTQVNEAMNLALLESVSKLASPLEFDSALDLFGGDGNLAKALPGQNDVHHIDIYESNAGSNFHSLNLMDESSLEAFASKIGDKNFDLFLVDPPRAGFRLLGDWVERFRPKYLLYVSCHPQTMVRDLKNLHVPHKVLDVKLLDLFPSTFHFEAMALIELQ